MVLRIQWTPSNFYTTICILSSSRPGQRIGSWIPACLDKRSTRRAILRLFSSRRALLPHSQGKPFYHHWQSPPVEQGTQGLLLTLQRVQCPLQRESMTHLRKGGSIHKFCHASSFCYYIDSLSSLYKFLENRSPSYSFFMSELFFFYSS